MYTMQHFSDKIIWMGVNDRRKQLFENLWPLPDGVSYNSYLVRDEKCALMDTVEAGSDRHYLDWVESALDGRKLDYLVIHHMELDHSGEIENLIARFPGVKIVGNSKTFNVLEAYYGRLDNLMEVKEGDTLDLGHHKLKFYLTPWVHWPETMMSYDMTDGVLFSGDAFGMFGTLDGGVFDDQVVFDQRREEEMRRYFSNIVGKYSSMVQRALAKLKSENIRAICPLHGIVWRSNPGQVYDLYDKWSRYESEDGVVIIYASMYGNTAQMADYTALCLAVAGVKKIKVHDISKTHISHLINDIWRFRGVMLGSCAYNMQMFPLMENLTHELQHMGVKNKYLGLFGSYSWSGGGVKNLTRFSTEIGWEMVADPVEIYGRPTPQKFERCKDLAEAMAEKLR